MTKVHPETVIKISGDMDSINANNSNNNLPNAEKKSSPSLCSKDHDVRNENLYRPGLGSKHEIPRPLSSSVSVANGRRLLVTGKSLNIPAQEFLEEITKCFSRTDTLYIKKTKDISKGLLGFQVISGYEVLNEHLMRICVLGLVDTMFSGFQFIIVNPFGVDAFIFKQRFLCPNSVIGPGITSYRIFPGQWTSTNFACDTMWYQLNFGLMGSFFPYWTFPFCGTVGKGPEFIFQNRFHRSKILAKLTQHKSVGKTDMGSMMKIDFSHSLSAEQRIIFFSGSLYAFYYHFTSVGKSSTAVQLLISITVYVLGGIALFMTFFT